MLIVHNKLGLFSSNTKLALDLGGLILHLKL